jgi:hypothetical protein
MVIRAMLRDCPGVASLKKAKQFCAVLQAKRPQETWRAAAIGVKGCGCLAQVFSHVLGGFLI